MAQTFKVDKRDGESKLVNLGDRTCPCGRWQLNEFPFAHMCDAIYVDRLKPKHFVDDSYRKET